MTRGFRIEPLGEVGQSIVTKFPAHVQRAARRRTHQCFDGMKAALAQDTTDQDRPQPMPRWNLRPGSAVSGFVQVGFQSQTLTDIAPNPTRCRFLHRFFFTCARRCWRSSTSSSALAARTSRTAS